MSENFIKDAIKKPGALRKALKIKKGHKIPVTMLKKAEKSKNPTMRKRATLADTLRKMKK